MYAEDLTYAERSELANALTGMQNDIYFAVFEDWDKRRFPPAKRDPEALDPRVLLDVNEGAAFTTRNQKPPKLTILNDQIDVKDYSYSEKNKNKSTARH